jgi:hypothetical protein
MGEIKKDFDIVSLVADYDDGIEFTMLEISDYTLAVNGQMTDKLGVDHKKEIKIGDYEIFDTAIQDTYGFCRPKEGGRK